MKIYGIFIALLFPILSFGAEPIKPLPKKKAVIEKSDQLVKNYFSGLKQSKAKKKIKVEQTKEFESQAANFEDMPESEIPLMLEKAATESKESSSPFGKMIAAIVVLLVGALVILFYIQRMGKRGALNSGAKNIKILSQKAIGPKKELMIIQVAGESILLGVTEQNINPIKTLSILEDELPEFTPDNFKGELEKNIQVDQQEESEPEYAAYDFHDEDVPDGYAVSALTDVKDIISRRIRP